MPVGNPRWPDEKSSESQDSQSETDFQIFIYWFFVDLISFPLPFYFCLVTVILLCRHGWKFRREGFGIPLMAVVVTAGAWYLIDPVYNDYNVYLREMGADNLSRGFWEVLLFFVTFALLVTPVHRLLNRNLLGSQSQIIQMMESSEIEQPEFQDQIDRLAVVLVIGWIALMVIALIRVDFDIVGLFFPFIGEKVQPWGRDRLATGGIDALFAVAGYLQTMLTALLGVTFALSLRPIAMAFSGIAYLMAVPFYLFDRTRNAMLAVLLPGLMALVTLRIRSGRILRLMVVIMSFLAIDGWMKFVIENRDQASMSQAFKTGGTKNVEVKARKHLGFNMLEELGFINYYIERGSYKVNWGERYFAEAMNPVPRFLWPGKPLIGIDYAIARGMVYGNLSTKSGGVVATVSTGMIGQGVVNFGQILGPMAAALLMAIWVAVLARQDLMERNLGFLLLYALGLALTFNLGRDITLLTLYPFIFGWILLKCLSLNRIM